MEKVRFAAFKRFMASAAMEENSHALSGTPIAGGEGFKETYTKNFLAVCQYVAAVNKSELPVLKKKVEHWDEFSDALVEAKSSALEWTNNIAARLKALPNNLLRKDNDMRDLFDQAIGLCDKLVQNPRQTRINELSDTMDDLLTCINSICSELSRTLALLEEYHDSLPFQAEKLQSIADKAMEAKGADEKKIDELKQDISKAKAEISSLSAAIAGLAVSIAASVFISVVAIAAAGPIGGLSLIFTGAAIATATAYIVIDSEKIKSLNAKIKQKQGDMDEYTADVASLQLLADGYKDLAGQVIKMEDCVRFITGAWNAMKNDIQEIKSEIVHAQGLFTAKEWKAMKEDFVDASAHWALFIAKAELFNLDNLKACNCKLELGMSPEEVKSAKEKGGEVDLIEYLTA